MRLPANRKSQSLILKWNINLNTESLCKWNSFLNHEAGGGYSTKIYTGKRRPEVQPLYPFINHFSQKRYSFRISSIVKWYPFHIPCLELCISFTCCKCTVFQAGINHKNRTFSWHFISHKIHLLAVLDHRPKWQISQPFYILQQVKSLPLIHKPEAWKRYLFFGRVSPYRPGIVSETRWSKTCQQLKPLAPL